MQPSRRFTDRKDAGEQLADALTERAIDADIVLAIPRGGLPLGRAVADALEAPLDVVIAKKVGAPGNPEYAIGAVASDGSVWHNEDACGATGADEDYVEEQRPVAAATAREKAKRYREGRAEPDLTGKTVVVVDDGVATGSTVRACLEKLQREATERIVLAVPVGPPETIDELASTGVDVVCLETPRPFQGVGQFYEDFRQVSDEEALSYLDS